MKQLDITLETLDHISGLAPHYSQKLIGLNPEKRFGAVSLTAVMPALGLRSHRINRIHGHRYVTTAFDRRRTFTRLEKITLSLGV